MSRESSKKPIIGIVAKYKRDYWGERQDALIRDEVRTAILKSGGIAIGILSTLEELDFARGKTFDENCLSEEQQQDFIRQIELCDGLVLQGGDDSMLHERWIAKYAYLHDIPIIGFCAGQSNMVRAFGGKVKQIDGHDLPDDKTHKIFIDRNSKFFKVVGAEEMSVNSRHKYAAITIPKEYKVVAKCEDGCPEVLEAPGRKFNFAIKFHPESMYDSDEKCRLIFRAFIDACKGGKEKK